MVTFHGLAPPGTTGEWHCCDCRVACPHLNVLPETKAKPPLDGFRTCTEHLQSRPAGGGCAGSDTFPHRTRSPVRPPRSRRSQRLWLAGRDRAAAAPPAAARCRIPLLRGGGARHRPTSPPSPVAPVGSRHRRPCCPPSPHPRTLRRHLPVPVGRSRPPGRRQSLRSSSRPRGPRGHPDGVARRDQPSPRIDHLPAAGPGALRTGERGRRNHPGGQGGVAVLRPRMRSAPAGNRRPHRSKPCQSTGLVPVVAASDRGDGVERTLRRRWALLRDGADLGSGSEAGRRADGFTCRTTCGCGRVLRPALPWGLETPCRPRLRPRPGHPRQVRARGRPATPGAAPWPTRRRRLRCGVRGLLPPVRGCRGLRADRRPAHLCAALVGQ